MGSLHPPLGWWGLSKELLRQSPSACSLTYCPRCPLPRSRWYRTSIARARVGIGSVPVKVNAPPAPLLEAKVLLSPERQTAGDVPVGTEQSEPRSTGFPSALINLRSVAAGISLLPSRSEIPGAIYTSAISPNTASPY